MLFPQHQLLLFAVILSTTTAQQNFTALIKSRPELSNLSTYFDLHPDIVQSVLRWPNSTFLAPSDEAFTKTAHENDAFGMPLNIIDSFETGIAALFSYHTLVPFIKSSDFWGGPHVIPTTLVDPGYTALSGGQVVVGNGMRGQPSVLTSGLQSISSIVVPDLEYEGGILHIINSFLTIPPSVLEILAPLGLTAAEGALTKATTLSSEHPKTNLTIFIPNNAAFEAVGSILGNMSETQLSNILSYHIVPDIVNYLDPFHNISLPTLISEDVHIVAQDGNVFVNSAEAVIHNVLAAEGVIHVIDNVLNPSNTTAVPDYAASTQAPAFTGATPLSGGVVPFTSGLSPSATGAPSSSTGGLTTGAKAGIEIGAILGGVGVIALLIFVLLRRKRSAETTQVKGFEISPWKSELAAEHRMKVVETLPMGDVGRKQKQKLGGRTVDLELDARTGLERAKDEDWG